MSNNKIAIEGNAKELAEFFNNLNIEKYSLNIKLAKDNSDKVSKHKIIDEIDVGFKPYNEREAYNSELGDFFTAQNISHH